VQSARRAAPLNEGRSDPRPPAPTEVHRTAWVFAAVATIVAIDQATKAWAVASLANGPKHVIGDTVEFNLTRNGGSAFSRFQGMTPVLAIGAIIVTAILVRVLHRVTDRVLVVALTLVLGGALGNLTDRFARAPGFLRGHVIDFVAVGWWPVFNVADSCVTVGAVLLVVRSLRAPPDTTPT